MVEAYSQLHDLGFAHSFEVWDRQTLVGGIYGWRSERCSSASMFSGASGGSRSPAALASTLHGWGWALIDAQVENPHLLRMGAEHLPRAAFLQRHRCADGREGPRTHGRTPAGTAFGRVNTNFASWAGHA
jgi:leucyl/phenylalanyl-tRNA--protein transferase